MFDFNQTLNRNDSNCVKWDMMRRKYGQDITPFSIADMDYAPLPKLQEAISRRSSGTFGYTFPGNSYYESIIQWFKRRHDLNLVKEDIVDCSGVLSGVAAAISAKTKAGDRILVNTPVYHHFFTTILGLKRKIESSPLICEAGQYRFDFEDIECKLRNGVAAYLLCNPHNPVGRVWTREELARIATLCERYRVFLISDEIHCDIVFSPHVHTPIFNAFPKSKDFAVLVTSPSKTFNIAGLRQAMVFAPNHDHKDQVEQILDSYHIDGNLFGWLAVETVYNHGEQWLEELLTYLKENFSFLQDALPTALPKAHMVLPEATYLAWLDMSGYGISDEEIRQRVLGKARILANWGPVCGAGGEQHIRLNIGTSLAELQRGLEAISNAFSDLK